MIGLDKQPTQAFCIHSSNETIDIWPLKDPKSGFYFVLWKDIQRVFENAKFVKYGTHYVPFMKDDNFEELKPLRIAYYPEVVLEVVVEGTSAESSTETPDQNNVTLVIEASECDKDQCIQTPRESQTNNNPSTPDAVAPEISEIFINPESLAMYSYGIPEEAQSSLQKYNKLFVTYFEAIASGQEVRAADIKQIMDNHFERLFSEMDKNKALQDQLLEMQKQMDSKQDQILKIQQQTANHIANIQSRVQALLVQTYELHECPIPRLFIVLPKTVTVLDKLKKPFVNQYRLYFLCECGTHTMSKDDKTLHEVHLAKHEGYDLSEPKEFFEKFGPYVLTLLYMIKYGVVAAGLVVPPLNHFKIAENIDSAQEYLSFIKSNISPLVNDTIKYLKEIKSNGDNQSNINSEGGQSSFDSLEALEGADLRQLKNYLNVEDQDRVLGNLYRIITQEGHVKWVCFDHYRANYRGSSIQFLLDFVKANDGEYITETGEIKITITSSTLAKHFYNALVKARGIQELHFTFGWDASYDDLQAFSTAVSTANVIRLSLDGTNLKGPARDLVNRSRRFDPILQLASNARVQSLGLVGFGDFFSRISNYSPALNHKLSEFSADFRIISKGKSVKLFQAFLEHCHALSKLELRSTQLFLIPEAILKTLSEISCFKSLLINCGRFSINRSFSQGKSQDTTGVVSQLGELNQYDIEYIQNCHLTHLDILHTPQAADESHLARIIQDSPLVQLRVGCLPARCLAVINLVLSSRERKLREGSTCFKSFYIMEEGLPPLVDRKAEDSNTHIHCCIMFDGDLPIKMDSNVQLQTENPITNEDPVCDFVRQFGWSIKAFYTGPTFSDYLAAILDDVSSKKGSLLERIHLDIQSLTASGMRHINNIFERSDKLSEIKPDMFELRDESEAMKIQMLLSQNRQMVTHIPFMMSSSLDQWLPLIVSSIPTRDCIPRMMGLILPFDSSDSRANIQPRNLDWIISMVTSPPQAVRLHEADELVLFDESESKKQSVILKLEIVAVTNIALKPDEWKALIKALDFTALKSLLLGNSNFTLEEFRILVDCIPSPSEARVPLEILGLAGSDLSVDVRTNPLVANEFITLYNSFLSKVTSLITASL
ncbi:hypothetical protein BGZ49_010055 [Haplosporangium sp. Z 27]|nr:hypothetical protein BGZ49_010055 [Haplosporangium sp. Z 27]